LLLRQLRYFAAAANEGSVAGAAKALRLSQPSLSRQLRNFENSLGIQLLERESRGVRVTPAGAELLSRIDPIFVRLERSFQRAYLASSGRVGTVKVALGRSALDSPRVARAMAMVRERLPDVQLVVSEVPVSAQADGIRDGVFELGIGLGGGEAAGVDTQTLYEAIVDRALVSSSEPFAKNGSRHPSQLPRIPLLVVGPSLSDSFPALAAALVQLGITEWESHESVESVYFHVAAGRGWTLAPSDLRGPPLGTVMIPVKGMSVPVPMNMRWRTKARSALVANVAGVIAAAVSNGDLSRTAPAGSADPGRSYLDALELRHLRSLVIVAEVGSLGRAAERLGLTQSGLSRQVSALERHLGFKLLQREAHGVVPTAAGEIVRAEAQATLALVEEAIALARGTSNASRFVGHCTVGCVATEFAGDILLVALKQLAAKFPGVTVEVLEMLSMQQVAALRERRIDVAITGANVGIMDDASLQGVRLVDDVIDSALLAETHPLARHGSLRPSQLVDFPFHFIERSMYPRFYDLVTQTLEKIGLVPKRVSAFNGPRALWTSTADSQGWTLGSRSLRDKAPAGLVAVPIHGLSIPSGLQLLWRRDESSHAVLGLLGILREYAAGTRPRLTD
jgi:DNA-binding transcriptional LysR family regulator